MHSLLEEGHSARHRILAVDLVVAVDDDGLPTVVAAAMAEVDTVVVEAPPSHARYAQHVVAVVSVLAVVDDMAVVDLAVGLVVAVDDDGIATVVAAAVEEVDTVVVEAPPSHAYDAQHVVAVVTVVAVVDDMAVVEEAPPPPPPPQLFLAVALVVALVALELDVLMVVTPEDVAERVLHVPVVVVLMVVAAGCLARRNVLHVLDVLVV
jgi:hypothetical protein